MSTKEFPQARILGIESSCDETAAAVIENGQEILSSIVASQADIHAQYGGVFPEIASRQHIRVIYTVVQQALQDSHLSLNEIDGIAVTRGPGLPGSLVVGINMAKGLALASELPLIGVNHLEAHLYSAWLNVNGGETHEWTAQKFPLLALIVSGGHTELILMKEHLQYQRLGGTLDDAAGEAFDKVARLLNLSYPGGPAIQAAASTGDPEAFDFPRAWLGDSWNFSFSGLKTAVLRTVRKLEQDKRELPVADLAASFQTAVVDVLVGKLFLAAHTFKAREILVAGGVTANRHLRHEILGKAAGKVNIPPPRLCTDNAAMIGTAGFMRFVHGQRDRMDMDALPTWPISEL